MAPMSGSARAAAALGTAAALSLLYLLFEAQWVRRRERTVEIADLPAELDGLTIAHLSDFHVGFGFSLNMRAMRRAVALTNAARPDLIVITGDLAGGRANQAELRQALGTLRAPLGVFAVQGNHDHGESKAPFVRAVDLGDLDRFGVRLLENETVTVTRGAGRVQVSGIDDWKHGYADLDAVLGALDRRPGVVRVLLSHYAAAALAAPADSFALTLSGDTHGGQLCVPWFGGPVMCSQPRAEFKDGMYMRDGRRIHVTRGVGTSLLPFRFLCRPEVVILRLVRPAG
jgi:predicted MPP superfamily phosphohydrolase